MHVSVPVFTSSSSHGERESIIANDLKQLCGAMKSLMPNLAVEADRVNVGTYSRVYDSNVFRPQGETARDHPAAQLAMKASCSEQFGSYFAAKQIGVADKLRRVSRRWMAVDFARRRYLFQLAHGARAQSGPT